MHGVSTTCTPRIPLHLNMLTDIQDFRPVVVVFPICGEAPSGHPHTPRQAASRPGSNGPSHSTPPSTSSSRNTCLPASETLCPGRQPRDRLPRTRLHLPDLAVTPCLELQMLHTVHPTACHTFFKSPHISLLASSFFPCLPPQRHVFFF